VRCRTPLVEGAKRCFIVSGGFSLVSADDSQNLDWAVPAALNATKYIMNQGQLNRVNPDILDVSFLEMVDEKNITQAPDQPTKQFPPDTVDPPKVKAGGNKIETWPWLFIGLGVIFVVMIALIVRRRNRPQLGNRVISYAYSDDAAPPEAIFPPTPDRNSSRVESSDTPDYIRAAAESRAVSLGHGSHGVNASFASRSPGLLSLRSRDSDDSFQEPFADTSDDENWHPSGRARTGAFPQPFA